MMVRACRASLHVFVEGNGFGSTPFCQCGERRNPAYRRSWWDRLRGLPKRDA
jgi:hypothetical protein